MPFAVVAGNESLTTTVVAADPQLTVSLPSNTTYSFQAFINWSEVNPTDGGLAVGVQITGAGATINWTTPTSGADLTSGQTVSFTGTTGNQLVVISGYATTAAAAGSLAIIRAQAVASANPTTLLAGSNINVLALGAVLPPTPPGLGGLQAAQIVSLACQTAGVPGFTSQAGQLLNAILSDLAQTYDFSQNVKTFAFTFDTSTVYQNNVAGAGPNILPTDYLRAKNRENIYYIQGVRYVLIIVEQWEFDALVQTAGWSSYPQFGYADLSLQGTFLGQKGLMVWPPASGAYTAQIRYLSQPTEITLPETSTTIPWFPNTNYLITRLSGELMKITGDERDQSFLGDGDLGSLGILRKYLEMKDDPLGRAKRVDLDRRFFGSSFRNLPNTKIIGWVVLLSLSVGNMLWQLQGGLPWLN